jgi:GDP-mannose 6-dehydrogenase
MPRKISVFGLGYVGSVSATCLASKGNSVLGVDLNLDKVKAMESGQSPIVEEGLGPILAEARQGCRLHATTDAQAAIHQTEISFVCVGTPSQRNGKLDLSGVERVCQDIGNALRTKDAFHWVVLRSTVLPGTTDNVVTPVLERSSGKKAGRDFAVCYNPEFLREGTAIKDFNHPPFTILGSADASHLAALRELYSFADCQVFETAIATAEMVKYVCNAFHAVKVGFANEIGVMAKHLGVDAEAVTRIFTSDTTLNISPAYLSPGFAFGGSCLPKDLRALVHSAKEHDLRMPLLESVLPSNTEHIERVVETVLRTGKRKIGVLGLSFKAGTDDLRESPLVHLVKRLLGEGCQLQIWDNNVMLGRLVGSNRQFIDDFIPHIGELLQNDMGKVITSSDLVLVGTRAVDRETILSAVRPEQIIIDLVNLEKTRRAAGKSGYEGICWS